MSNGDPIRCPSHRCKPGSDLIGVRQDDGTVAILPQPLPVDKNFVEIASRDATAPEQRFRFSNKCIEGGCSQWTGSRCGVIDNVMKLLNPEPAPEALPPCGIRPTCRWFLQSGPAACKVCPYVVTHITEQDTYIG
jgi:hypothetical protein